MTEYEIDEEEEESTRFILFLLQEESFVFISMYSSSQTHTDIFKLTKY